MGITNVQQPDITLYPNPASGTLHISSDNTEIMCLVLIDMLGLIAYDSEVNDYHHEINVSQMQQELNFLQMHTTPGTITERVQVIR